MSQGDKLDGVQPWVEAWDFKETRSNSKGRPVVITSNYLPARVTMGVVVLKNSKFKLSRLRRLDDLNAGNPIPSTGIEIESNIGP